MKTKPQAFLITGKSNIRYLSNFTGSNGFILLTKTKKYLFTDSRYILRAKNTIKKDIKIIDITKMWKNTQEIQEKWQKTLKKHKVKLLGVEETNLTVYHYKKFKKISPKIKLIDCSEKIEEMREIKTDKEICHIRKSQRINEKVFGLIKKVIQREQAKTSSKLTEIDIAWQIEQLAVKHGANGLSFAPIVAFGKNSASPHHQPEKTKLKKSDLALIDMGMKYKGYCSDMTRIVMPKKPTQLQKDIYKIVLKAQETAIKGIKKGITGKKADALARDVIIQAGYGEYYTHAGGHGVGLDIHESPSLSEHYKKTFKENSVITVEPGIYLEGKFGIRIEDMVRITKKGNKNLTKIKKTN